ncbi:MAG TPA: LLM class flavin-dependent oxidoreductase [Candidatus Binataceae bacterium]|nr:LLM class flavin-dependent oxidoreductase [Candidatus Binataceae bacterium]
MEFGIQLANLEPARIRDLAQAAEGLGFDYVLFPDHIVLEGPERQFDPHALAWDMVAMATYAAAATKRIRIGHLVLCNLFRHPAITAQSLMTLDHVSGGRAVAGLGSGWTESEFRMTGIPFPPITARLRMLDEALTVVKSLWTKEQTNFDGEFYKLKDAILWPKPVQKPHPPIFVGGGGKGLLRIAAKHADYLNIIPDAGKGGHISMDNFRNLTTESFREKTALVKEEAKRNGRNAEAVKFSSFLFMVQITDSPDATRKTAGALAGGFGLTADQLLQSPMMLIGTPDQCVAELRRRSTQWGVSQFIFSAFSGLDEASLRRLKEQVLAHL